MASMNKLSKLHMRTVYIYIGATLQVTAVASHINEYIRQHENAKKMLRIQSQFTGGFVPGIIAPGRNFIKEGKLMKARQCIYSLVTLNYFCRSVGGNQKNVWSSYSLICYCTLELTC